MPTDLAEGFNHRANRVTSGLRSVGGRLLLEDGQLIFQPNVAEKALQAGEWSVRLSDIVEVKTASIKLSHLFSGGLRPRLVVRLNDGDTQLFVISAPNKRAAELKALQSRPLL